MPASSDSSVALPWAAGAWREGKVSTRVQAMKYSTAVGV